MEIDKILELSFNRASTSIFYFPFVIFLSIVLRACTYIHVYFLSLRHVFYILP